MPHKSPLRQDGVTLIELIMSIMIISITSVGLFSVINITNQHSADPLILRQAIAIAESYMEEILQQNYSGAPAASRPDYTNVDNYNGLVDSGAHDQQNTAIPGLGSYTVNVSVSSPMTLTGSVLAKEITVTVIGPGHSQVILVGYRASY